MIGWIKKTLRSLQGKTNPASERDEKRQVTAENTVSPNEEKKQPELSHQTAASTPKRRKKRQRSKPDHVNQKDAFPKNKIGIRILTDTDDLNEIFSEAFPDDDWVERKPQTQEHSRDSTSKIGKKVRVLSDDEDMYALFGVDSGENSETGGNFRELLEQSLKGENFHTALREKIGDKVGRKKPLTRETTRAYPPPETDLDLHGCTSVDVAARVENEIKSLRREGVRTLRIIVGKGLHSPGRAVLPDLVEKKLAELKRKGSVLTFHWEKRAKRKSGALIVCLR